MPRLLQVMHELIEADMGLVRLVHRRAHVEVETAAQLGEPAPDFTLPAERMSRSVRRSVMIAMQLEKREEARAQAGQQRAAARKQVIRAVEDAIDRERPEQADRLETEFLERLDSLDFEADISGRPVAELIVEVQHDLGLGGIPGVRTWKRRTPADLKLLGVRAATKRPATGPFVLPMPPRDWTYDNPLFPQGDARIRGP